MSNIIGMGLSYKSWKDGPSIHNYTTRDTYLKVYEVRDELTVIYVNMCTIYFDIFNRYLYE